MGTLNQIPENPSTSPVEEEPGADPCRQYGQGKHGMERVGVTVESSYDIRGDANEAAQDHTG